MPFKIVRNDITKMKVDAIVNTANPNVRVGRGVDYAIYKAAGYEKLLADREKIGPMERGSAAITEAYDLNAKYIIHTVGPRWDEDNEEQVRKQLKDCYDNSMSLAMEYGLKSIAFPLISTGSYAFPKEVGLRIAYDTISRYLYVSEMDVYLVVYDDEAFALSKKLSSDIDQYIDSHYVEVRKSAVFTRDPERNQVPHHGNAKVKSTAAKAPARDENEEVLESPAYMESTVLGPSKGFVRYGSIEELLAHAGETFQDRLYRYLEKSGKSDVEVYKGANMSKQTFSKIRQPGHIPKKRTILCLAISMGLGLDETRDLLESAGMAFSPSDKTDLVVQYCITNGINKLFEVDCILFDKFGITLSG